MGNGFTTKLHAQWFLESDLETRNTTVTVPTLTGWLILLSFAVSIFDILRRVTK